ncbi:hypothetical protein T492DRAFT_877962 [Pavlovales sp. CCMP2436]|nr:hypothetical protein T492DRAFT_877962 [Pavlovales sp. CCMP2436]
MEERDEGGRLPHFYTIGDKQIGYLPFTEAKAAEHVHCPICLDALGAGLLDSRNVYEGRKDNMIAKYGHNNRTHPDDWESYKSQQHAAAEEACSCSWPAAQHLVQKIKWQGYPASKNSWMPLDNLTDDLVAVVQGLKASATRPRQAIIDDSD